VEAEMATNTITIPVDPSLVEAYETASKEDREKFLQLVEVWLSSLRSSDERSLSEIMDVVSEQAQAHGLTEEMVEVLLNDEE
jgi:hypothetical protein